MNLPAVFRIEARKDFDEAADWYEAQRPGLGADFVAAVQETLNNIQAMPQMYPLAHRNIRRAMLRRFPYGVFYRLDSRRILIVAVFHGSRDPKSWQSR